MDKQECLVIDNGTYMCKAGISSSSDPNIIVRNYVYRIKEKKGLSYLLEGAKKLKNQKAAYTLKTMFDGPVVYNYEVFEGTMHAIIQELKIKNVSQLVITECFLNPKMFKTQMLHVLFSQMKMKKVQIGYDMVYAYEYNLKNNKNMSKEIIFKRSFCDVIVSMSHQGVYIIPVDPKEKTILYNLSGYLPLGGSLSQLIFTESVASKYYGTGIKVPKEEVEKHFTKMRVPLNYFEEIEEVVYTGKGNILIETKQPKKEKIHLPRIPPKKKVKQDTPIKEAVQESSSEEEMQDEIDTEQQEETLEQDTDVLDSELQQEEASEVCDIPSDSLDAIKRAKREKLIKGATEHRNKQKIIKCLSRLHIHIMKLEEKMLLMTDPKAFMNQRKQRLAFLDKIIKKRNFIRSELKNKKSSYSLALLKETISSSNQTEPQPENQVYLDEIADSQKSDLEILDEIEYIDLFLKENDPSYQCREENIYDRIRNGYDATKQGININIEFLRIPEGLFNPSILGIENPGITEMLSDVFQARDVRNIFITGGFSRIQGIKQRVEKEIIPLRHPSNEPVVVEALDPVYDAFHGAVLSSEYFPIYTQDMYKKSGNSIIVGESEIDKGNIFNDLSNEENLFSIAQEEGSRGTLAKE
ncbi:actin-related protein 5 [Nematocida sp. LUAm3]|nr:actin-related protein 5 [Nematocida sp. LUAm3]KAI5173692.1 actin-related protein 5 [Nematocida sp. LUAm2]KAI5176914.1 actin-related protein 5 [Nematocida sp. LUAm1]